MRLVDSSVVAALLIGARQRGCVPSAAGIGRVVGTKRDVFNRALSSDFALPMRDLVNYVHWDVGTMRNVDSLPSRVAHRRPPLRSERLPFRAV